MIITRLELDGFAGLADFSLDLTDGINVFYGANGTGKTTLGLFIKTMLYGVGTDRKRDEVTNRMRLIPIGAQKAGGRMVIEINGRQLEIARTFGLTKKHDRIAMTWLDDGSRLQIPEEPGEYFLEINEETFSRTFFVGEMNQAVLPGNTVELTARLMNLSTTGHENMDFNKAVKKLKDEAKALVNQRGGGSLEELRLEKADLEQKIQKGKLIKEDLEILKVQIEQAQTKKVELTKEVEVLKQKADSLEQLKELEDYGRAMLLLAKKADLERRIQNVRSPLDVSEIAELKAELDGFLAKESQLEQKVDRHNEAVAKSTALETGFNSDYDRLFHPANEKTIREFLSLKENLDAKLDLVKDLTPEEKSNLTIWTEQLIKIEQRRNAPLNWRLIAGSLFFFFGLYGWFVHNYALAFGAALGLLILAAGLVVFKKTDESRRLEQKEAIKTKIRTLLGAEPAANLLQIVEADPNFTLEGALQSWTEAYRSLTGKVKALGLQMSDLGDYLKEQAQYINQKNQWQLQLTEIAENHQALEHEAAGLEEQRQALTEKLRPLELTCAKPALSDLDRLLNGLAIQKLEADELSRTMLELKQLSQERNLNPLLLEPQKYQAQGVRRELDLQRQLISELDRHKATIADLDIQIVKAQGQLETFQNLIPEETELTAKLIKTTAQIEWAVQRHRILELALENLEESYREIQRDYLPRVSQKLSETFGYLTAGRFDQVLLTGDYRMKLPLAGEMSSMEYLSRGNLDLLWLGLRLSLCGIIISGEKAPLIFDDSFLHLDEERLNNVLSYLSERIDGQIIILTCHHRETRLLKEMDLL